MLLFIDDRLIYSDFLQQKNNVKEKKIYFTSLHQSDFGQKKEKSNCELFLYRTSVE